MSRGIIQLSLDYYYKANTSFPEKQEAEQYTGQ